MHVYIQSKRGIPLDVNSYAAYQGFSEMGFETRFVKRSQSLLHWTMGISSWVVLVLFADV